MRYEKNKCPGWGSNSRPSDYETDALPTEPPRRLTNYLAFTVTFRSMLGSFTIVIWTATFEYLFHMKLKKTTSIFEWKWDWFSEWFFSFSSSCSLLCSLSWNPTEKLILRLFMVCRRKFSRRWQIEFDENEVYRTISSTTVIRSVIHVSQTHVGEDRIHLFVSVVVLLMACLK